MEALKQEYIDKLEAIKEAIQSSEELNKYLEEEGEEEYKELINAHEGQIHDVYTEVADNHPLQIIAFENQLLDHGFEGLYLPKILGYTVLRGKINENYEYFRPQSHFKDVLEFIISSSNFEQIKMRVGQSIQIGFALSSDIWITNIINSVNNKQVKSFLESQNMIKYHDVRNRRTAYVKYIKQFQSLNFYTADFPTNHQELLREFNLLKSFLLYRSGNKEISNENLKVKISELISNHEAFNNDPRYIELLLIIGMHYDLGSEDQSKIKAYFDGLRTKADFDNNYFSMLLKLWGEFKISPESEMRISNILGNQGNDKVSDFYQVTDKVHGIGYINEDAINATRDFYYSNEGLSKQNTCLRRSIFNYYQTLLESLDVADYADYFEVNKTITHYINIFDNQQFNQDVKDTSLRYIKKLLKHFTDKRGRDYQDIKKFVWATFSDLNFMNEKELKELFKTKRKAKTAS